MGTGPEGKAADLLFAAATHAITEPVWPGYRGLFRNGSPNMRALGRACGIWLDHDLLAIELEARQLREEVAQALGDSEQFSTTYDDLTLAARIAELEWTTRYMEWVRAPALHAPPLPATGSFRPLDGQMVDFVGSLHASLVQWLRLYVGIARRFRVRTPRGQRCYLPGMRCKDETSPARDLVLELLDVPLDEPIGGTWAKRPTGNRNRYAPYLLAQYRAFDLLHRGGSGNLGHVRAAAVRTLHASGDAVAMALDSIRLAQPMRYRAWGLNQWALWIPELPGGASHDTPQTAVVCYGDRVAIGRAPVRAMWPEGRAQRVELTDGGTALLCTHAAGHIADPDGRKRARLAPPAGELSWFWAQSFALPYGAPTIDRWIGVDRPVEGWRP